MSDFDEVLERLVSDPGFRAALSADPQAALRDYRLDGEELALLSAQLELGDGGDRAVEERVSKSGLFGMVGPVISALGFVTPDGGAGEPVHRSPRSDPGPFAPAQPPVEGVGIFGSAPHDVAGVVQATFEQGGGAGVLEVADPSQPDPSRPAAGAPAAGYHTRVDADGDGRWDPHRAVERGDGGVDILVDRDGDGVVDWIGHDLDRDGLIESASVDTDHDGLLDTRFVDDTGDGWLDRRA